MRNFIFTIIKSQWKLSSVINMSKSVIELILMIYLEKKVGSYEFALRREEKGN